MPLLPTAFRLASFARGARAFHPRGVGVEATWYPAEGGPLPSSPLSAGPAPAVLRLSHGVGLPPRWPDVLGWALRLPEVHGPGRHQDLLLASTGSGRLGRHLLRPARDLAGTTLSSLLPYRVGDGGLTTVVARAADRSPSCTYATLLRAGPSRLPAFEVHLAGRRGGLLATVVAGERLGAAAVDALRLDPWNTGEDLVPAGRLNRLRAPTYAASQAGRAARSR